MPAFNVPLLDMEQGANYRKLVTWATPGDPNTPVDLTGLAARAHFRSTPEAATAFLELSTDDGTIVLGGTAGTVEIVIPPSLTEGVTWRTGVYDLEIVYGPNSVRRLMKGKFKLSAEVTHE